MPNDGSPSRPGGQSRPGLSGPPQAGPVQATHRGLVFVEHLVIAAERDTEDDGRDVLEAVDPLLAFRSLAPDVKQPASKTGKLGWWAVGPRQVGVPGQAPGQEDERPGTCPSCPGSPLQVLRLAPLLSVPQRGSASMQQVGHLPAHLQGLPGGAPRLAPKSRLHEALLSGAHPAPGFLSVCSCLCSGQSPNEPGGRQAGTVTYYVEDKRGI